MIDEILKELTIEELVGQVLCYDIYDKDDPKEVEKIISKIKPGGIFLTDMSPEKIRLYTDIVNKYTKVPVIVASDIENGPETAIKGGGYLPYPMAWGAADDAELIYRAGKVTGEICRKNGVHLTFSPVVDINYNFRSPECNVRAISDSPDQVIKISTAFIKGLQNDGNMAACVKHFPGQGIDERNSHFCTGINDLSREEWFATYGRVYKEVFKAGTMAVMVGHIALPAFENNLKNENDAPPAGISRALMTDLLKGELGFNGAIISDAMSMVGISASCRDIKLLGVDFLRAGGDMILFPEPTDSDEILKAVFSGELEKSRLYDAARRVLSLKNKVGLLKKGNRLREENLSISEDFNKIAQCIADKSIKIVRDENKIIPSKLPSGSKVLLLVMQNPYARTGKEFEPFKEELESFGLKCDVLENPSHYKVNEVVNEYDMVVLCVNMSSKNYHGGTLRFGWDVIMVLWRAYALANKRFICVSFGDPYKIFDMPYLKEYVNAFSFTAESQRAVAKVLLGKMPALGKNPVSLKGFFEREV